MRAKRWSKNPGIGGSNGADKGLLRALFVNRSATDRACQRVVRGGRKLQNAYHRFSHTCCTHLVRRLVIVVVFFERINTPPHIGFRKLVARRLSGKVILLILYLLKLRQAAFERYLRSLGLVEVLEQIQDHLLRLDEGLLVPLPQQTADIMSDTGRLIEGSKGCSSDREGFDDSSHVAMLSKERDPENG